uniref:Integrase catalytic domain-containing protein n=1 Tax=Heterorhabditis bacteriophora TaxID=37862 RepID=A0A1I7WLN9_HETBA
MPMGLKGHDIYPAIELEALDHSPLRSLLHRKDLTGRVARYQIPLINTSEERILRMHADFLGPLPLTLQGNKYILVIIDAFTKYAI